MRSDLVSSSSSSSSLYAIVYKGDLGLDIVVYIIEKRLPKARKYVIGPYQRRLDIRGQHGSMNKFNNIYL